MKPVHFLGLAVVAAALAAGLDFLFGRHQGALLFNLAVFTAMAHGCIALVAAAELCQAKWIQPIKKYLLQVYPVFFVSALMFLGLIPRFHEFYGEAAKALPNWMNPYFFFLRNEALLLLSLLLGWLYGRESLRNGPLRSTYGVLYLFVFVATNSFIAFDWIMPLEYPWFSTLLGGFFFIESLYTGVMIAVICSFFLIRQYSEVPKAVQKAQYDSSLLMFGFSILWCYLFFSQLIVIWYGNVPFEVAFFIKRVWGNPGHPSPYWPLAVAIVLILFLFPFTVLQFRKVKANPKLTFPIALVLYVGFLLERFFFIRPNVPISLVSLALQYLLLLGFFLLVVLKRAQPVPEEVAGK